MLQKISIQIRGMTCQSCASRIDKLLNRKAIIHSASVNFATEQAVIQYDDKQCSVAELLAIIEKAGFQPVIPTEILNSAPSAISLRLWILLLINIPFLIGMIGMLIGTHHLMLPPLWQCCLATIVQCWIAWPFYRSAIASLKGGLANMDVLISLGSLAIYLYSLYLFLTAQNQLYFEASVMVIGFVSLGKYLEQRIKKQNLDSISILLQLTPQKVRKKNGDHWQEISLNQVNIGDILQANIGDRIATDGVIVDNEAWIDESHLTGESKPLYKTTGQTVLAGAMVIDGSINYRTEKMGQQTLLGDMITALSEAQNSKAPIARIADKVAGIFVPSILIIALLTFVLTLYFKDLNRALIHSVSVLVIACPCVLGLATPVAIMVGISKAMQMGVYFKDAPSMEKATRVTTVIFDKTGTITQGTPQVMACWCVPNTGYTEYDLYYFATMLERYANHPLAKAILQAAEGKTFPNHTAIQVKNCIGEGIEGELANIGNIKVGSLAYCQLTLPSDLDPIWKISSIVAVAVNHQPIGAFAIADSLKTDSQQAINSLNQQHFDCYIMSGDNQTVVDYVASQLGIKQALGQLTPRKKAEQIKRLQAQGKIIAMVGDGINDSLALNCADVSFAMKNGTDVAKNIASATLMQYSLKNMVTGLLIARATLKNIKQNLFFAFIYNLLAIPLAALGYLNPVIAGAAMALSSLSVLLNALRLKRQKFPL